MKRTFHGINRKTVDSTGFELAPSGLYYKIIYIIKSTIKLTNRLHFSVCVYCNRSQMTSQRVKNKKVRDEVEWRE